MRVDVVENLLTFLKTKSSDVDCPPDVSAWVLAAELALLSGDAGCVSDLLCEPALPLPSAERLAAHKKVRPGAVGTFLSRPDLPADVLLRFIRREQRPAVLRPVASTLGLPDAVYCHLAKSQAVSVLSALLENPSVLPAVKLTVFERCVKRVDVYGARDRHILVGLHSEPGLHQAAFDTARQCWAPPRLLEFCSQWSNIHPDQTVHLLTVAEDMLRDTPDNQPVVHSVEKALCAVASHPQLSGSVLTHIAAVAAQLPDPYGHIADAVAVACTRHAANQTVESLRAASRSELVDAVAAGTVRTDLQILAMSENPVFDLGLVCQLLAKLSSIHHSLSFAAVDRFVGAASVSPADLLQVFTSCPPHWSFEHWLTADVTLRVFTDASSDELVEALAVARPQAAWRRFVELAAAAHNSAALTDEVVAPFGWASPETAYISRIRTVQPLVTLISERVYQFLLGRLGTDPAVWAAFSSIVDGSVSLGDTADLAVLAGSRSEQQ